MKRKTLLIVSSLNTPLVLQRAKLCTAAWSQEGAVLTPTLQFPKLLKPFLEMTFFFKKLSQLKPDLIHIHFAAGPYAAWAYAFSHAPLMLTIMGAEIQPEEQPHPTMFSRLLTGLILRTADAATVKSRYLKELSECRKLLKCPVQVLYWGVEKNLFKPCNSSQDRISARQQFHLADSDFVLLSPRTPEPLYNVDTILEAFLSLAPTRPHLKLLIVGKGGDASYLEGLQEKAARSEFANRVLFLGQQDSAQMATLNQISDACVMIPKSDGLPQSLLESMACGLPTVLSPLPQYEEIAIPHENCVISADWTVASVASSLQLLVDDKSGLISRLKEGSLRAASQISREEQMQTLKNLYEKLQYIEKPTRTVMHRFLAILLVMGHYLEVIVRPRKR